MLAAGPTLVGSTAYIESTSILCILKCQTELSMVSSTDTLSSSEDIDTHSLLGQLSPSANDVMKTPLREDLP